jgi:hypothetical protein
MSRAFHFLFNCLAIFTIAPLFLEAQKGYAKLDAGPAVIFKKANASASLAFGYKHHSRAGIGAKIQAIKNYGTLFLGELRGFIPLSDVILFSVAVDAGKRVYNNRKGNFVYGFEGGFMFGRSKLKLCLSAAGFFLQEKKPDEIINFGAFYPSLGIIF